MRLAAAGSRPAHLSGAARRGLRLADVVALALLLPLTIAATLAVPDVWTRGEARESLVVRELVAGGDPIAPRRDGVLASKPPLFHWLGAVSVRLAGATDVAIRAPSAVSACGLAMATFAVGMALFDRRRAWLAVGALLSTVGFWRPALEARVDMLFAACIAAALAGFAWWYRDQRSHARAVVYAASAAAVLTKGPAGLVIPLVVIVAALAAARDLRALRGLWAPRAALAAGIAVGGWYALAWASAGREFVEVQIVRENLARAVGIGPFVRQRTAHPAKLLEAFVVRGLPWSPLALAALVSAARLRTPWSDRFLHAWWIGVVAVFSLAAGKRGVYVLPALPAVALLAGDRLARVPGRRLGAGLALAAIAVCLGTVTALRREAAGTALPAFADAVRMVVPATASLSARWGVSESDRLVLAHRLRRAVPRLGRGAAPSAFVIAPRGVAMPAGCVRRVEWPVASPGGLLLLDCGGGGARSGTVQDVQGAQCVGAAHEVGPRLAGGETEVAVARGMPTERAARRVDRRRGSGVRAVEAPLGAQVAHRDRLGHRILARPLRRGRDAAVSLHAIHEALREDVELDGDVRHIRLGGVAAVRGPRQGPAGDRDALLHASRSPQLTGRERVRTSPGTD